MINRVYSRFELKSFDESSGEFEGIASTPATDRMGDIVEPKGALFTLPLPLLWQHDAKQPIGLITKAKVSPDGITVSGKVMKDLLPRISEAWTLIRAKLVRGLSIGFAPIESVPIDKSEPWGAQRFIKWDWLELSAVTIPANADANIQTIKSFDDEQQRAASGAEVAAPIARLTKTPGVTGKPISLNVGAAKMKTMRERIAAAEAKRASLIAANKAIMDKTGEEDRTCDASEDETFRSNADEVKAIDAHLEKLREQEKMELADAIAVTAETGSAESGATEARSKTTGNGGVIYGMKTRVEPGVRFARYAMCVGAAKGNLMQAELIAASRFKDTPEVALALKTAVNAGTTQDATWAAPLVQLQEMQSEFVEFLRPQTLIGRIPNLRRVPFNIKFTRQTAGVSGTFVGEGLPKPLGKMDFELLSLLWFKAATIIVMTEELLRFSNPNAEILARNDLAAGIAQYLDKRFIDPVYAGVANVSPASITNGVTPIASLGTSISNITDTAALAIKAISTLNLNLGALVWLMSPGVAIDLGLKRTTQDIFAFPGLGASGGTFLGYPVITSNNLVLSGSPTESFVVLMDPTNVMLADDGGVSIDMSTEASLQMSDAPSDPASSTVSLWQSNLVALRAERFINWRKRHDGAVQVITMNQLW